MTELKIVEKEPEKTENLAWKVNGVIINDIISRLHKAKVVKEPTMKFIYDDHGIFDTLFSSHMTDPEIEILRKTKPETFLMIMAVHSMGAGMVVIYKQKELGRTIGKFTAEDVDTINGLFKAYDAYQLACQTLGAEPGSPMKNYLDTVAQQGVFLTLREAGEQTYDPEVLEGFAKAMYNIGVTIALG